MRSESEANALLFSAKRSEANSQFRFRFRNNAKFALRMYTPAVRYQINGARGSLGIRAHENNLIQEMRTFTFM